MTEARKKKLKKIARSIIKIGTRNEQWARVIMNRRTKEMIHNINPSSLSAMEISGNIWAKEKIFKSYKRLDYPAFDVCESKIDEKFDLIIAEQVFEHLLWPYKAGKNVYDMLNDHGYFLITTPFLVKIHNFPIDCSRWTELGLKYFLAECGFDLSQIQTGSWGNRACIRSNFIRFWDYRKYLHPLKNEPDFPIVIWALAKKTN